MALEVLGRKASRGWAAWVAILAILLYLPILQNGFVFDDHGLIEQNSHIQRVSNLPLFFTKDLWSFFYPEYQTKRIRYWRPLLLTTWALVYKGFGLDPVGYHLASLIFHGLASLLVFLVGRALTGKSGWAAVAAALFAVHPVHVDAVAWASGLSDILVAVFALASLGCYHLFRTRKTTIWALATLGSLSLTFLSKESGITFPLVLAAYELLLAPKEGRASSKVLLASTFGLALLYFILRRWAVGPPQMAILSLPLASLLSTLVVVAGHYCRLLLFPIHLVATYPSQIYRSLLEPEALKALFFLFLFCLFLVITLRSKEDIFWLLFTVIPLIPALLVVGLATDLLGERYLYLPSVGFCFLLTKLLVGLTWGPLKPRVAMVLGVVFLGSLALRTIDRTADFRDELTYLRVTLRDAPLAYLHHNNLGDYLVKKLGDLEGAQRAFETSLAINPKFETAHHNLAIVSFEKGDLEKALYHSLQAAALNPLWVDPLISAAEAAGRLGKLKEAKELLRKALDLDPDNAMALNNMGNVVFLEGNLQEAMRWWKKSEASDPTNERVLYNLALGYEKLGQKKLAASYYRRFAEVASARMGGLVEDARRKARELSPGEP